MSKPKKKRQHKCRKALGHRDKYENEFVCKTCRNRVKAAFSWHCAKCGGSMVKVGGKK